MVDITYGFWEFFESVGGERTPSQFETPWMLILKRCLLGPLLRFDNFMFSGRYDGL